MKRNRCQRCNELLHPDREVWLELDQRTNTYTDDGDVPPEKSQGSFAFGRTCAKIAKAEHAMTCKVCGRKNCQINHDYPALPIYI